MNFGSQWIYIPQHPEQEEIFPDEIEDGLASSAKAQATIWAEAASTGETHFDQEFLQTLVSMGKEVSVKGKRGGESHHDAIGYQNGVFSSARRLQPRFQGKEKTFDELAAKRAKAE